ncbi:hypothetical protein FB451DRAFT_1557135 [Mycena latifolia]|nr:hypothetical protein FB451DRAFT_1557135 [Mycena latifolia]
MHCTSVLAIFYPPLLDFAVLFLEFASAFHCALVPGGTDCSGVCGFINGLLSCTWALTFALSALKQVVSTSRHLDSVEAESGSKYGGGAPRAGLGGGGGVLGDETPSWSSTTRHDPRNRRRQRCHGQRHRYRTSCVHRVHRWRRRRSEQR